MSLAHASPPKMPAQRWRRKKPIGAGKGATHCPAPNITTNSANELRNKRLLIERISLTLERYIWQRANRKQLANGENPLARFRIVGRTGDCHWRRPRTKVTKRTTTNGQCGARTPNQTRHHAAGICSTKPLKAFPARCWLVLVCCFSAFQHSPSLHHPATIAGR